MLKAYLVPHPPLLVPGVGRGDEIPATRAAYRQIAGEIKQDAPETLVIISPHSVLYEDYFHVSPGARASGDFAAFGARQIRHSVAYDTEFVARFSELAQKEGLAAGTLGERSPALDHGVLVPLHFLESGTKPETKIVRLSLSGLSLIDHYRLGQFLRRVAEQISRRITIIASGDMSHKLKDDGPYGYVPEGPEHDAFVRACVEETDFIRLLSIDPALSERVAECGLRSLVILAGALDGLQVQSRVLAYEDTFGVGYLTASFLGDGSRPSLLPLIQEEAGRRISARRGAEDAYVRLARVNTESYILSGMNIPLPDDLPPEMLQSQTGVFVSIKKDGNLRGCIGTITPTSTNIAREILRNSVAAAAEDPRFDPIEADELDSLIYSVDVLAPAEPIDSPSQLNPERYGVIVSSGRRRGLLLPNLEGVTTVEQQIAIALQKAGIRANEPYSLERFEVVRHE